MSGGARSGAGSRRHSLRKMVAAGLAGVGVAGLLAWGLPVVPEAAEELPRLAVSPPVVDLGTIRKGGGTVEATFTLRNEGRRPLRVQRIVPT